MVGASLADAYGANRRDGAWDAEHVGLTRGGGRRSEAERDRLGQAALARVAHWLTHFLFLTPRVELMTMRCSSQHRSRNKRPDGKGSKMH